jgi:RHS repeat-associated protein
MARVVAGRRCDAGREFQIEGNGSTPEHLIYLEGYEDRVGGYRTRSYVDDYAHLTRYRYGQLELRFVLTDRLGSVVSVVRADRDSGGYVTALEPETGLAYDVFGAPRHATTWAGLGVNQEWPQAHNPWDVTPTTRHGFTGHEMLSKQRLIHMRGRLFDPRMGRFTGVDPVIQFPLSTQGLNPYSYLLNNPLAGTDPTGYCADAEIDGDKVTCTVTPTGSRIATKVEGTIGKNGQVTFSGSVNTVGGQVLVGSSTLMSAKVMSNGAMSTTQIDRGTSEVKKTDRILSVASRDNAGKSTLHTSEEQVDVSSEEDLGVMWEHGLLDESQREVLRWGRTSSGQLEDVTIVEETLLGGAAVKSFFSFAKWTWGLYKLRAAANGVSAITKGEQVTEQLIREVMRDAPLRSQQAGGVSLPRVQAYVDRLLAGEAAPAIKVDGQMIVDGNHRYIAGRILGREPPIQPWAGGRPGSAVQWDALPIDPAAWQ